MKFFVLSVLFVALLGFCLISTSDATSSVSANITTLSLATDTGDTDADAADEKVAACGIFRRMARPLRVLRPLRNIRPFRGRCSSCG